MGTQLTIDDFVFVPIEEATVSPGGIVMCLRDRYWAVDAQGRIAYFNRRTRNGRRCEPLPGAPQCNVQEEIVRSIMARHDWVADIVFLPFVFHKINPGDYVH